MSEPESNDEMRPPKGNQPPWWWLRGAGLALAALTVGLGFTSSDAAMQLGAWSMGMLGVAVALFGQGPKDAVVSDLRDEPAPATVVDRAALQPLRILGFGSAAIALIGVAWVLHDVTEGVRATQAWWVVVAGAVGLIAAAIWSAVLDQSPARLRVEPPEDSKRRLLISCAVAAVLIAEIAIPATYYFGDDRFDERFAWRMFSDVRVYQCQLGAYDIHDGRGTPVNLPSTVHVAWINTMRRSREDVLQRFLRWRCEDAVVDGVRIVNQCRTPEGESVPPVVREIECTTGHITSVEVE